MTIAYVTNEEFRAFIERFDEILDAVQSLETQPLKRRVGVFRPRTLWGLAFPPKHLSEDKYTDGIPFGEGDFAGMLVSIDGHLRIAVPMPNGEWYRPMWTGDYVMYYLAFGKYSIRTQAVTNIVQALWCLEQLLPDGHRLKVTPFGIWKKTDSTQRIEPLAA